MIHALILASAMQIAASNADVTVQTWTIQSNASRSSVSLDTRYEVRNEHGSFSDERSFDVPVSELGSKLPGLSSEQLFSSGARVHFRQVRDAGTIEYDGQVHGGAGGGEISIVLNPQFAAQLQRRGIGAPTADQQRRLTLAGAGYSYLDLLAQQGFEKPDIDQFLRLLDHGVSTDYLRGMAALRLTPHSIETIVRARDHGVSPAYAQAVIGAAYGSLSIDDLIRLRDHGVSAEFIRGMRGLGYAPSSQELIRLRDHGVSVAYVAGLRQRGYTARLSVEDLIRLRDHGI